MPTRTAFLPPPILPPTLNPRPTRPPRCSNTPDKSPTRRIFLARVLRGTTTVLLCACTPTRAHADPDTQPPAPRASKPRRVTWGYAAENGPSRWADLSEDWALCATGASQSPVALSYRAALPPADAARPVLVTAPGKFAVRLREAMPGAASRSVVAEPYIPPPPPLVGDAPPVDTYKPPPPPAVVTVPDLGTFVLRSFHFHVGASEHVLDGNVGVLEAHFVFEKRARAPPPASPAEAAVADDVVAPAPAEAADPTQTLVVGLIGSSAERSAPWLEEVVGKFPALTGDDSRAAGIVMEIDLGEVLPDFGGVDLYTYSGSLTTPPCTEGIYWIVLGDRMDVAEKEVNALLSLQNGANVRPLQPLNDRKTFRFPAVPANAVEGE